MDAMDRMNFKIPAKAGKLVLSNHSAPVARNGRGILLLASQSISGYTHFKDATNTAPHSAGRFFAGLLRISPGIAPAPGALVDSAAPGGPLSLCRSVWDRTAAGRTPERHCHSANRRHSNRLGTPRRNLFHREHSETAPRHWLTSQVTPRSQSGQTTPGAPEN